MFERVVLCKNILYIIFFLVNCSNTKLTEFPRVPLQTTILDLSHNRVSGVFRPLNPFEIIARIFVFLAQIGLIEALEDVGMGTSTGFLTFKMRSLSYSYCNFYAVKIKNIWELLLEMS